MLDALRRLKSPVRGEEHNSLNAVGDTLRLPLLQAENLSKVPAAKAGEFPAFASTFAAFFLLAFVSFSQNAVALQACALKTN